MEMFILDKPEEPPVVKPQKKNPFKGTNAFKGLNPNEKKRFKSEERCREIFEGLFDKPFPSVRPDWLKNPSSGLNLELDGFCPTIKTHIGRGLAFEYDGQQHARFVTRFHSSPKDFVKQYDRDLFKDKRCKERGVLVIRIPHTIPYGELDKFIVEELKKYRLI
jgi:hypothetical protein